MVETLAERPYLFVSELARDLAQMKLFISKRKIHLASLTRNVKPSTLRLLGKYTRTDADIWPEALGDVPMGP